MYQVERLAGFVSTLRYERIPSAIVEKVRIILLHNLSMALAGGDGGTAGARYLRAAKLGDPQGATVFLTGSRVPVQDAALANGILFHARAQDDVQHGAGSHLGAVVLPAALAVAEWVGLGGQDLIASIVAGYEAASVVGMEFSKISTLTGFRSSGIYGPFASAAAASLLMGLDARQTANALSLAANFAAGLNQTWLTGTEEFRIQTALASRNGILAALLAQAGVESAPDILEGMAGFYRAYTGAPRDIGDRLARLGFDWNIREVSFKPYPVCGINQVPVHLMLETLSKTPFDAEDIESITVGLIPYEAHYPGINARGPFRDIGASLMSTQFSLATTILKNGVRLSDLRRFNDPTVMRLINRIEIVEQPDLPPYGCSLSIHLKSGQMIRAENRRGADNFKFTWDEAVAVARSVRPEMYVSDEQFERLLQFLRGVDRLDRIEPLIDQCLDPRKPEPSRTSV